MSTPERPTAEELGRFSLFAGIGPEEARLLADAVRVQRFAAGACIFQDGDPVRGFYLVRSGRVKIHKSSPSGNEQVLTVCGPGMIFAEAALFRMPTYPASSEALEDAEVLFVEKAVLLDCLRRDPEVALRMLVGMAGRLQEMVRLVEDLTLRDARSRTARYITSLVDSHQPAPHRVRLPVSQALLARMLGLTNETLSRTLKGLREEGLFEQAPGRGQIVILDMARLREAAGEMEITP